MYIFNRSFTNAIVISSDKWKEIHVPDKHFRNLNFQH